MTDVAICVEGVGRQYRIGGPWGRFKCKSLVGAIRHIRRLLGLQSPCPADRRRVAARGDSPAQVSCVASPATTATVTCWLSSVRSKICGIKGKKMGLQLHIPDSVTQAIRLPEKRMEEELLVELAIALYAQEVLSFGKARELAGMSKQEFGQLLGRRGVIRHYGRAELEDDLAYAYGE